MCISPQTIIFVLLFSQVTLSKRSSSRSKNILIFPYKDQHIDTKQ